MIPPDAAGDAMNVVLSRELYNLILQRAALPVLLGLIGLSWVIINHFFDPQKRQERRSREIRTAAAARQARLAASGSYSVTRKEANRFPE